MSEDYIYPIRYKVEPWDRPREEGSRLVSPGVRESPSDYGYADAVFVASIMLDKNGDVGSVLLMDSVSGSRPSRGMLELIKAQIEHHLEQHTE